MRYRLRAQFFWIIACMFFLSPVFLLLIISFTGMWRPDESITFRTNSWQTLFTEPNILEATFWSAWIGLTVVLLNLMIAVPAGKAVVYYSFKGKPLVEALFLAPILLPVLLIAMGTHILMIRLGLADTSRSHADPSRTDTSLQYKNRDKHVPAAGKQVAGTGRGTGGGGSEAVSHH